MKKGRNFCFITLLGILSLIDSCKARKSQLSSINAGMTDQYLDISLIDNPALLKQVCLRRDLYIFVGNGEKFGQVIPRSGLTTEETKYLANMAKYEETKEQWYFAKITKEYESLKEALAVIDPVCMKAGYTDSRLGLIGILDGPAIGDSQIEVTSFSSSSRNASSLVPRSKSYRYDQASSKLLPKTGNFELLMPRDVELILRSFDLDLSQKSQVFGSNEGVSMVVPIFKGHSVEVRPVDKTLDFSDAVAVGANKRFLGQLANLQYEHASLLDFQDENGPISIANSKLYSLVWSPHKVCEGDSTNLIACLDGINSHLSRGFLPNDMEGCASHFTKRLSLNQGDRDGTQGDRDGTQGDRDGTQGGDGFFASLDPRLGVTNSLQGGKGFAISSANHSSQRYLEFSEGSARPLAVRAFGDAVAIDAKPGSGLGQMRSPIHAETEMMFLDTCSMDLRSWSQANWLATDKSSSLPSIVAGVVLANPMPLSAYAIDYRSLNPNQYAYLFLSTLNVLSKHRNEVDGVVLKSSSPEDFAARQRLMNSILNQSTNSMAGDDEIRLRMLLKNMSASAENIAREKGLMAELFSEKLIDQTCNLQTKLYRCIQSTSNPCRIEASFPNDSVIDQVALRRNNRLFMSKLSAIEAVYGRNEIPTSMLLNAVEAAKRESSLDTFAMGTRGINIGMTQWLDIQHKIPNFWSLDSSDQLFTEKMKLQAEYIHELKEFHRIYSLGEMKAKPDPLKFLLSSYKINKLPSGSWYDRDGFRQNLKPFANEKEQLIELTGVFYDLYIKLGAKHLVDKPIYMLDAVQRVDYLMQVSGDDKRSNLNIMRDLLQL